MFKTHRKYRRLSTRGYRNIPSSGDGIQDLESMSPYLQVFGSGETRQLNLDLSSFNSEESQSVVNTFTAGEDMSALKLVYMHPVLDTSVYLADPGSLESSAVLGITKTAALAGQDVEVLQYGIIRDDFFGYLAGELLFLGAGGTVTNIAPNSGYLTRIGRQVTNEAVLVLIETTVAL